MDGCLEVRYIPNKKKDNLKQKNIGRKQFNPFLEKKGVFRLVLCSFRIVSLHAQRPKAT
jgi:hypothetical protein